MHNVQYPNPLVQRKEMAIRRVQPHYIKILASVEECIAYVILVGPQLGLGRAALQYVIDKAPQRSIAYTSFQKQNDSVAFQLQVADAAVKVDIAHLLALRAADYIDEAAARGVYPDYMSRARMRIDGGAAVRHITDAIDILLLTMVQEALHSPAHYSGCGEMRIPHRVTGPSFLLSPMRCMGKRS